MSEVNRFILPGGRELRTTVARDGNFVVALYDTETTRVVSLSIHRGELTALRRALADLAAGQKRRRAEGA